MKKKIYSVVGLFSLLGAGLGAQTVITDSLNYNGGNQTWTVPCGVTSVLVECYGAQGGSGAAGATPSVGGTGGYGGYTSGTMTVTPGQVLYVMVGGAGTAPTGGFNGGGNGGTQNAGGGGGASDVRINSTAVANRIIVAGGGGGGGRGGCEVGTVNGGNGGSGNGGNGSDGTTSPDGGGGFGAIGANAGSAGIGCGGFLGTSGSTSTNENGANGGAGQACCCFSVGSIPGGGGGGGGMLGGGGGGGGSAGTTGCSGNNKGGGGGGAGGTSYADNVIFPSSTALQNVRGGDGVVKFTYTSPTPGVLTFTGNNALCDNVVGTLSCNNDPYATFYTWTLDPALNFISGQNTNSITYSGAAGTYTLSVSGTNSTCSLIGPTSTFTVTIYPSPTVTATSTSPICAGSTGTLGASGANVYDWQPGSLSGSTVTVTPSSTTTYTLVGAETTNGCMDTTTTTIVVNPLPNISATATPATTVCAGTMVTANGTGGVSYVWSGGVTDGVPFAATATQTYTCTGTDANGCVGTFTGTITVNQLPTPTVTSTNSSPCLSDAAVTLTGSPAGGTYSGTGVSGNMFTPATAGVGSQVVTYTYTDANSCTGTGTTTITVNACTGISSVVDLRTMSLTPNPASDVMHLTWDMNKANVSTLEIFDVTGRVVMTQAVNGGSSMDINVANLPAGNYNLVVTAATGKATYPFVKQ